MPGAQSVSRSCSSADSGRKTQSEQPSSRKDSFMPEVAAKAESTDPRVATAIAHGPPRSVSTAVLLADVGEVTAGIGRWEDWCRAWCERGEVHEALGREALAQGYKLTAGEHLVRAAMYYHFAKFVFVHDQKQMRDAHLRSVECYQLALPLMRPTGERVSIPFEGKTLYGILRRPVGATGRSPVLIMAPGLDSTKEELHAYAEPFLARRRDPGDRRTRAGRGGVRDPDMRRLRARRARRVRLGREARRSRRGEDRHVGREPRWLLRAARDRLRKTHQGLHRALRAVRVEGNLERAAGSDARGVPRAQPLCKRSRRAEERRDPVDERGGGEKRLPALHRHRSRGPARGRLPPGGPAGKGFRGRG